jgi:S1-C subfamily serine protease
VVLAPTSKMAICPVQGLTVTVDEEGRVLVARIIYGSFIERQGLLRPGDVVLEANGQRITSPEQVSPELMKVIARAGDRR